VPAHRDGLSILRSQHGGANLELPAKLAVPIQDLSSDSLLLVLPRVTVKEHKLPTVGGILLLAKLGQGGMGAVYYGMHPRLRKEVAVKVLPFQLAEHQPDTIERFFREAQVAAQVQSPHLVGVMDVNEESGLFYLVMEFVNGVSAGGYLKLIKQSGKLGLDETEALDICIATCHGLAAAHAESIIHRDVKPDNIMLPKAKEVDGYLLHLAKLADLGLASGKNLSHSLTGAEVSMGTPGYMPPEQAMDARNAGKAADVFGVGASLYALLAGRPPFIGDSATRAILDTMQHPHTPVRKLRPDVSLMTATLIDRCLEKDEKNRFSDSASLLNALRSCRGLGPELAPTYMVQHDSMKRPTTIRKPEHPEQLLLDLEEEVHLQLMLVHPGDFIMGDPGGMADEKPAHKVRISQPFYIGRYPITTSQYRRFVSRTGYRTTAEREGRGWVLKNREWQFIAGCNWQNPGFKQGDEHPAVLLSYADAQAFISWATRHSSKNLRMPTEAEWEYAARGQDGRVYPWGNEWDGKKANHADVNLKNSDKGGRTWAYAEDDDGYAFTSPVGKLANASWCGASDMAGNIWEWCQDWYAEDYYESAPETDPKGPEKGFNRVLRGGSWSNHAQFCRCAVRLWYPPTYAFSTFGFRVAVGIADK